jgi:hypothetical protein
MDSASRAFNLGVMKSRNARSFSGNVPWPGYTMLTGHGSGSNALNTISSPPACLASTILYECLRIRPSPPIAAPMAASALSVVHHAGDARLSKVTQS